MTNQQHSVQSNIIHLPDSWQRLVTVIKHQARAGNFIFIEAPHKAGKTTFANVLKKKLTLISEVAVSYQSLHPLSNLHQIYSSIPDPKSELPIVILDDAGEVSADVLEDLISSNIDNYYVILAESDLINRVPRLQNSRFNLPLFNKNDCHKLLNKMYQTIDPSLEVQTIDSELVYYESKGFPWKMKALGLGLKDKIERKSFGLDSFESANKSVFTTVILGLGVVILLLYLFWPNNKNKSLEPVIEAQEQRSSTNEGELILISEGESETSALSLESGELPIDDSKGSPPETFDSWIKAQNPDSYTIQLYSNASLSKTEKFMQELDLADSFVYKAKLADGVTYRLVWGAYPNRARAQLAIGSLPKDILSQKPWLRSFSSIKKELNYKP